MFEIGKSKPETLTQPKTETERSQETGRAAKVFFALWPDDAVRKRFTQCAQTALTVSSGRIVTQQSLHLTLVFLGNISLDRIDELKSVADQIVSTKFSLNFSNFDYWRGPKIVCLIPDISDPALPELVKKLEHLLSLTGFGFDQRPYQPHVTLLRNVRTKGKLPEFVPIPWSVHDFVLVQSALTQDGPDYRVIGRWRLWQDLEL